MDLSPDSTVTVPDASFTVTAAFAPTEMATDVADTLSPSASADGTATNRLQKSANSDAEILCMIASVPLDIRDRRRALGSPTPGRRKVHLSGRRQHACRSLLRTGYVANLKES